MFECECVFLNFACMRVFFPLCACVCVRAYGWCLYECVHVCLCTCVCTSVYVFERE